MEYPRRNKSTRSLKERYNHDWQKFLERDHPKGDLELTLQFLERNKGIIKRQDVILEMGCGNAVLTNWLYNKGYTNIIGTDLSEIAIVSGKRKFKNLPLKTMDAAELGFPDNKFDVCLSFDLVEHIPDIDKHFREVLRVLKPNGVYLFQTPNVLANYLKVLWFGDFSWNWQHPSLQFSWEIKRKLYRLGFQPVSFAKISPLSNYKLGRVSWRTRRVIRLIPFNSLPIWLQTNFWITAHKPNDEKFKNP